MFFTISHILFIVSTLFAPVPSALLRWYCLLISPCDYIIHVILYSVNGFL
nr:MAG TPA: hypothetical protein [Caudoviricetes sp.]